MIIFINQKTLEKVKTKMNWNWSEKVDEKECKKEQTHVFKLYTEEIPFGTISCPKPVGCWLNFLGKCPPYLLMF